MTPKRKNRIWTCVLVIGALAAPSVAAEKVLRLHLDGPVMESPADEMEIFALLGGQQIRSLHQWVSAIQQAADDSEIKGIVLVVEHPQVGLAQVDELTRALQAFRAKGKKVLCYMDAGSNSSYALAAAGADHITLAEYSSLDIVGLHAELSYYKGLFDKIGLIADMMHCGDYKSASEPFTRTEPSKEAAEQVNWLLDGIFARWIELIASGRKLTPEQVKEAVDSAPLTSRDALSRKLIDAVGSFIEFKQLVQKEFGRDVEFVKKYPRDKDFELDFSNPFALFQKIGEIMEKAQDKPEPGIGLVYVDGGIAIGKSSADFWSGGRTAGSTSVRAALDAAREAEHVKAVVLRVDSPGGSALASDIIWDAATRLAKEKPLIVSMGNVAGSGGYYVSIPGDTVFAEAATITGSIGVVGGKIIMKDLFEDKLGITTTEYERGKRAGLSSVNRPWNDDERKWMTEYMNGVYDQFKGRVKQSRGERIKGDLEKLAGGRVYTGKQALERGLIDRIGGVSDALALAAEKAGLKGKDYDVYVLPKKKDFADIIKAMTGEETPDEWDIALGAVVLDRDPLGLALRSLAAELAPAQLKRIAWGLRNAFILHRERVGCFMPFDLTLR